jgi:hypothetical protein
VPLADELRDLLAAPAETLSVDFKREVNWSDVRSRIETARDVVCLSNRNGGRLVLGVEQTGPTTWKAIGLQPGDHLPDPTDLGKALRTYFDPVPTFEVREVEVDGLRFGVVQVQEFARTPIICKAIGNAAGNAVVRPGYFYRRSDAMECAAIITADGAQAIIESAVAKTGAAIRSLASPTTNEEPRPAPAPVAVGEPVRLCDLVPRPTPAGRSFPEIQRMLSEAAVHAYGGIQVPRSIDAQTLPPSAIVREPERLLIVQTRELTSGRAMSLVEVTRRLEVRIREGLWEPEPTVDYSTIFAFVFGCLSFARDFFKDTGAEVVETRIGLGNVLGRQLTDNPAEFLPFVQAYVATSAADLTVEEEIKLADLANIADY